VPNQGFYEESTCRYCRVLIKAAEKHLTYQCDCGALVVEGYISYLNKPTCEAVNV